MSGCGSRDTNCRECQLGAFQAQCEEVITKALASDTRCCLHSVDVSGQACGLCDLLVVMSTSPFAVLGARCLVQKAVMYDTPGEVGGESGRVFGESSCWVTGGPHRCVSGGLRRCSAMKHVKSCITSQIQGSLLGDVGVGVEALLKFSLMVSLFSFSAKVAAALRPLSLPPIDFCTSLASVFIEDDVSDSFRSLLHSVDSASVTPWNSASARALQ
jgi:hypothetical protein